MVTLVFFSIGLHKHRVAGKPLTHKAASGSTGVAPATSADKAVTSPATEGQSSEKSTAVADKVPAETV